MGTYSVLKIWMLWQRFPDEIHVERGSMVRPNWQEVGIIFYGYFDWSLRIYMFVLRAWRTSKQNALKHNYKAMKSKSH